MLCSFFVDTKIAEAERKRRQQKRTIRNVLWGGVGIKIGIECVGENPNAKRVTLLQLHRTGRTISDNVAFENSRFLRSEESSRRDVSVSW